MTPIQDHKQPRRLADMTPRQRYYALRDLDFSEQSASKISGFDEREELEKAMRVWSIWAIVVCSFILSVLLLVSPASASNEDNTEQWFAACLGGAAVQVGGRVFRCLDVGGAK